MKIVNRIRRSKASTGAALATTPIALESYRAHFAKQFTNDLGIAPYTPVDHTVSLELAQNIFHVDIVKQSVLASPAHKAPGITGLTADLLRPVSSILAPLLALMFETYFLLSVVPNSWTRALICPVPKKGDLNLITNYRPISLTETSRKIYEMCLMKFLQPITPLSLEQGGFRSRRSTIDQVEALDRLIRFAKRAHRRLPELAFLDIKAAYDSVPRGELWRRCEQLGYQPSVIASLQSLFDHNTAQLVINQQRSTPFGQPAGVLQGSVLSPMLYSVFIDPITDALRTGPLLTLPNGHTINCLLYADDIVLIANNPISLKQLLSLAEADSMTRGYRFSPTKCVVISPSQSTQELYSSAIDLKVHFNYLGVEFNSKGIDEDLHVQNRVAKAKTQTDMLASIGARYLGFPRKCSVLLYRAFIRPGLEYAITLIKKSKANLKLLEVAQKKVLCRILGVAKNSHNVTVSAITMCPPMAVRQASLGTTRHLRFSLLMQSPTKLDYALPYVLIGLCEPLPTAPTPFTTKKDLLEALFHTPMKVEIDARFAKNLSLESLRSVFNTSAPGDSRMLLLWIFRKFKCFNAARKCRMCGTPIRNQDHVSFCGSLPMLLAGDIRLPQLPEGTLKTPHTVEKHLMTIESAPRLSKQRAMKVISEHILAAVISVFGSDRPISNM